MSEIDSFAKEYGEGLIEEIFNCFYDRKNSDKIHIHSVHMLDSVNYEFMATIYGEDGMELCEVSCRDGNWRGSEIRDYGDISTPKRYRTVYFLDIRSDLKHKKTAQAIFSYWKDTEWFKEMERDINYDLYFDPSEKTEKYWEEKASKKGMIIKSKTVEVSE